MDRSLGLGGTDAMRVMSGEWLDLYKEKVGEQPPVNLDDVWRVQLGKYTEPFHREWLAGQISEAIFVEQEPTLKTVGDNLLAFAHFDGRTADTARLVELKHSNQMATARDKALYYAPQLAHYMFVGGFKEAIFSIIPGNDDPQHVIVERNEEYIDELMELERKFWWHVSERVPPEILPTAAIDRAAKTAESIKLDGKRKVDMSGNNQWPGAADDYLQTKAAFKRHNESKAELKEAMPDDAYEAYGNGIVLKRDKRGAVRITETKE